MVRDSAIQYVCYCKVLLQYNVPLDRKEVEFYVGVEVSVNE